MKIKHALMHNNRIIAVFNTLADAEEMCLAFIEEGGYEHCNECINRTGIYKDFEDYCYPYRFYHNKGTFKTSEGAYLYIISGPDFLAHYHIKEVLYFED